MNRFEGSIGWTKAPHPADETVGKHISHGAYRGFTWTLYQITHEAASAVLTKAGQSNTQVKDTLASHNVYVFQVNATQCNGKPYLFAECKEQNVTVRVALYNVDRINSNSYGPDQFQIYFKMENGIKVKGQWGQLENYSNVTLGQVAHPLRREHEVELQSLERKYVKKMLKVEDTRSGTNQRDLRQMQCEDAKTKLDEAYAPLVEPHLMKNIG